LLVGESAGVKSEIFTRLREGVEDGRDERVDAGDGSAQPGFGKGFHYSSPDAANRVLRKQGIGRQQRESVNDWLADEHFIEGIAMQAGYSR
jgi:hypothetical protein